MTSFQQTLDYLYTRLPVFHRQGPAALKPSLDNTLRLCAALGDPQHRFKSIHIAGTNGKGSVSSMLASILMEAGLQKVGLYTSPHLKSFTERIRISGQNIPEDWVVAFVARVKPLIEAIEPSFFELTVAMCFDYFAQQGVDVAVIEVGLGGRLDSTNIITPQLSVITNISFDHMELLGDTLDKIAAEKAGIIKPGVPAVVGEALPETRPVFDAVAARNQAPIRYARDEYDVRLLDWNIRTQTLQVTHRESGRSRVVATDLTGGYQLHNVRTAVAATDSLNTLGYKLPDDVLLQGLANVRRNSGLRGRMDILAEAPLTIADVAHNQAGITTVIQQITSLRQTAHKKQLHVVYGMVKDKDASKVLSLLPRDARYYFVQPDLPRALPAQELQQKAQAHGLGGAFYPTVAAGLAAARGAAHPDDLILITGSIFVVAEAI
jgi:dihydrofolate synthase/folylpolyglutamate synthase